LAIIAMYMMEQIILLAAELCHVSPYIPAVIILVRGRFITLYPRKE